MDPLPSDQAAIRTSTLAVPPLSLAAVDALAAMGNPRNNLWELAVSQLRDKDKAYIDFGSSINLQDLLSTVQDKQKECVEKQWSTPGGTGNTIKIRDLFTKITKWIEKFIEVGDVAAQYDPGHAALPWAAVRFILKKFAVVLEGVEAISNLLVRNDIYTTLYLRDNAVTANEMKRCMVNLYTSMLSFLAKAKRYYTRNTPKRIIKTITQFADGYRSLLDKISQQQKEVDQCASILDAEFQRQAEADLLALSVAEESRYQQLKIVLDDLQKPIDRMQKKISDLHDHLQESERHDILNWLSAQPYIQHHDTAKRGFLEGTGTWLLKDDLLLDWQRSSASSILWLHGIPGSGKSKLVSIIIEHLHQDFCQGKNPRPIYFYCSRNASEKERSNPTAILASLVRQMSCHEDGSSILEPVREKYAERKKQGFTSIPPSLEESTNLIIALTEYRPLTTIVVDALDECDRTGRPDLLQALERIINCSSNLVKIFVSSRNDQDIVCHLNDCPNLEIEAAKNQADIISYVNSEVHRRISRKDLLLGKPTDDLVSLIIQRLCDEAQGMFSWVELQLQFICSLRTSRSITNRLGKLPQGLGTIYEDIYASNIDKYDEEDKATTEKIFRWLLCSQRPLESSEFCTAMSLSEDAEILSIETILELSCNLVVHDKGLDVFRFAHLSVREYLERKDGYSTALSHATVAETCLAILSTLSISQTDKLREYACWHWALHCKESGAQLQQGELEKLFNTFMLQEQDTNFALWSQVTHSLLPLYPSFLQLKVRLTISEPPCPIFAACLWGFAELPNTLLKMSPISCNWRNIDGYTPLYISCYFGNVKTVQRLLEKGADVNAPVEGRYGTALQAASGEGHDQVVQRLLENGADVNAPGGGWYGTALQEASGRGHYQIVQQLLEKGANVNTPGGGWYGTALQEASRQGHNQIVQRLLENGADVNAPGRKRYATALQAASGEGHDQIVQQLLKKGAEVNAPGRKRYGTALQEASGRGHYHIVQRLLEKGADVNAPGGGEYGTALQAASSQGHYQIVQRLLEKGADINAPGGGEYGTALQAASRQGHDQIVQQLLKNGADVNAPGGEGYGTALQEASGRGHNRIVQRLLEKEAAYFL